MTLAPCTDTRVPSTLRTGSLNRLSNQVRARMAEQGTHDEEALLLGSQPGSHRALRQQGGLLGKRRFLWHGRTNKRAEDIRLVSRVRPALLTATPVVLATTSVLLSGLGYNTGGRWQQGEKSAWQLAAPCAYMLSSICALTVAHLVYVGPGDPARTPPHLHLGYTIGLIFHINLAVVRWEVTATEGATPQEVYTFITAALHSMFGAVIWVLAICGRLSAWMIFRARLGGMGMTGVGMSVGLYTWTQGSSAYYTPGQTSFVGSIVTWSCFLGIALAFSTTNREKLYQAFPMWVFQLAHSRLVGMLLVLYVFAIHSLSQLYSLVDALKVPGQSDHEFM